MSGYYLTKEWNTDTPEMIFIFFNEKFTLQYECIIHLSILSWFCHWHYNLHSICHLQYQKALDSSLKISYLLCWNMSHTGTALNDSLKYLYLQNW